MMTKSAKMYNDKRVIERTPEQIVKTIKAQCYVKGKSGEWINYAKGMIQITHKKLTGIIISDTALVYYEPDNNLFHAITDDFGYVFEP